MNRTDAARTVYQNWPKSLVSEVLVLRTPPCHKVLINP